MDKYHETNPPTELKSVVLGRKNSRKGVSSPRPCSACGGNDVWERVASLLEVGTGLRAEIYKIKNRVGEIESLRSAFEAWISASPYERDIDRWPNDESSYAWPGQYLDVNVALAWEAWQEAAFIHSLPNTKARQPEGSAKK